MANTDTANVIIRPPIAWAVAVLAGLALDRLVPLRFVPAAVPAGWVGAMVFALALALLAWAIATITRAGSSVPTNRPTTAIVETGPYCFTRNPIYLGMMLGLVGLAIALNSLWLVLTLWPLPCTCAALAVMLCAKPAVAGKMLRRAVPSTLPRDRRMNYRQHGC